MTEEIKNTPVTSGIEVATDSVSLAALDQVAAESLAGSGQAPESGESEQVAQSESPANTVTAGMRLRAMREAASMSLSELAVHLKVPERKLELLESDQYDQLPGLTFVRALASSICRVLKADNAPILALLPNAQASSLTKTSEGINAPFHKPSDRVTTQVVWDQHKQTILIAGGLVIGAVVLFNLPQSWLKPGTSGKSDGIATEQVVAPALASSAALPAQAPVASSAAADTQAAASQALVVAPAASQAQATAVDAFATIKPATVAISPASSPVVGKFAKDLIAFEAKADSWIEVTQADGQTLMRRTLKAGEKEVVGGVPPLNVSIGNADKTRVSVRGKTYDLGAVAKENVARFKVE